MSWLRWEELLTLGHIGRGRVCSWRLLARSTRFMAVGPLAWRLRKARVRVGGHEGEAACEVAHA